MGLGVCQLSVYIRMCLRKRKVMENTDTREIGAKNKMKSGKENEKMWRWDERKLIEVKMRRNENKN